MLGRAGWAVGSAAGLLIAVTVVPHRGVAGQAREGTMKVAIVTQPYSGSRNTAERSGGPVDVYGDDLAGMLRSAGCEVASPETARLSEAEEPEYGTWHRLGLANGHLAELVSRNRREGAFTVGLLANCNGLMGMLGGLQHSGPTTRPLRVGLVWIDAHGDFNTPETTLSGMLGGMPVAVSTGLCLTRLRQESGLDPALPVSYVVMACVRDTDPLEQELIDRHQVAQLTVEDIRNRSDRLHSEMERLSALTDVIYIHIDMDVLDPAEVQGHSLNVAGGPTSVELAAALTAMFGYEKTAALGIASTPWGEGDPDGLSRAAAHRLIEGAVKGVLMREAGARDRHDRR